MFVTAEINFSLLLILGGQDEIFIINEHVVKKRADLLNYFPCVFSTVALAEPTSSRLVEFPGAANFFFFLTMIRRRGAHWTFDSIVPPSLRQLLFEVVCGK